MVLVRTMPPILCTMLVAVCSAWFAPGQSGQAPPETRIRLNFPSEVPPESIRIMYVIKGRGGARGEILGSVKDRTFVEIAVPAIEQPITEFKVAAYLAGCENVTLDLPLNARTVQDLPCRSIGTRRLHGRIVNLSYVGDAPARVDVSYPTGWMCRFFQLADCMTPMIHAGTAEVRNGEFTLDLPDIASAGKDGTEYFDLELIQPANQRHANLRLEGSREHTAFQAHPEYDAETRFVAEEFLVDSPAQ